MKMNHHCLFIVLISGLINSFNLFAAEEKCLTKKVCAEDDCPVGNHECTCENCRIEGEDLICGSDAKNEKGEFIDGCIDFHKKYRGKTTLNNFKVNCKDKKIGNFNGHLKCR